MGLFGRKTAQTVGLEPSSQFVAPKMHLDFDEPTPTPQYPVTHDVYIHREDGRTCIPESDGSWFVPLDAGGEGYACTRPHPEVSEKANRYYVFRYSAYYPEGGMNDCVLRTKDREEAIARAVTEETEGFYYVSVWDVVEEKLVVRPEEKE